VNGPAGSVRNNTGSARRGLERTLLISSMLIAQRRRPCVKQGRPYRLNGGAP